MKEKIYEEKNDSHDTGRMSLYNSLSKHEIKYRDRGKKGGDRKRFRPEIIRIILSG